MPTLTLALILAGGLGLSLVLTRVMMAVPILDRPQARSSHSVVTPRTGGIAVVLSFAATATALLAVGPGDLPTGPLAWFVAAAGLLCGAALYDDIADAPPLTKLAAQVAAALLVVLGGGFSWDVLPLPGLGEVLLPPWAGTALALAWLLFFTNAFNFMDGINGIAGVQAALAGLFLALIAWSAGQTGVALLALAVVVAVAGFLCFNFPAGRIFMGDVGSQFLGLLFATLTLVDWNGQAGTQPVSILVVPILVLPFAADVALTLVRRARRGENLLKAHRDHLYQLLIRGGMSHAQVTGIHAALIALCGLLALATQATLPPGLAWIGLALALGAQAAFTAAVLGRARRQGLR
ncbi:MraY family glycosyltransferase [Zavarzinia sp. CC-PAN008]|uniref:MraY family glycosyltransferase n=1 Tax=Zavarzinia sp. CC-PAN008 TaxID=3243332 RepID=UPI003F742364